MLVRGKHAAIVAGKADSTQLLAYVSSCRGSGNGMSDEYTIGIGRGVDGVARSAHADRIDLISTLAKIAKFELGEK